MLKDRKPPRNSNSRGLSLVELMVALVIGLIILMGVMTFFSTSVQSNRQATQKSRLNQELNGTMEMMVRDIRRAGYWGLAHTAIGNPTTYTSNQFISNLGADNGGISIANSGSCILFRYDRDDNGCLFSDQSLCTTPVNLENPSNERFGFRISQGAVQMLTSAVTASQHTCSTGPWESISDARLSEITRLEFKKTHTPFTPNAGVVCTREIEITLTGRLVSDTSVSQNLNQIVRVRADWYGSGTSCPTQ